MNLLKMKRYLLKADVEKDFVITAKYVDTINILWVFIAKS